MENWGSILSAVFVAGALLLPVSSAIAATDGFYQLTEVTAAWDGTDASRLKAPTADYDYTYGDEASLSYTLPWSFSYYGTSYSQINVDTNGNVWFTASGSANSFNLTNPGRGPVIAAWNNDLSSYYYGGAFVQHKTNPERVVIEWQAETYSEEGYYKPNNFEVVLYQNGTFRIDYKSFTAAVAKDFGSGISKDDGAHSLNLSTLYGNTFTLAGRSFAFAFAAPATMTSPLNNTAFVGETQAFSWTNAGASLYQVWVGTTPRASDIGTFPPAGTTDTTTTVTGLPTNGSTLYVSLRSKFGDTWYSNDYTYTVVGPATMTTPLNNATLTGASQTFTWTNSVLTQYQVWAGSTVGGNNYGSSGTVTGTTATLTGLPINGSTVYARLWTLLGTTWSFNDYTYTAAAPSTMVTPANATTLAGASQVFTWTNSGASMCQVWVGSTLGTNDIGFSPQTTATSAAITGLPINGSMVYVRLWSLVGSSWLFNDYTYHTLLPPARIAGATPVYYSTLQAAYDAAVAGDVIQVKMTAGLTENITANKNITVTIDGGYDDNFVNILGKTSISGSVTISAGTVNMSNILISN